MAKAKKKKTVREFLQDHQEERREKGVTLSDDVIKFLVKVVRETE